MNRLYFMENKMFPTLKPSALALAISMVFPVAQALEVDVTTDVDGVEYSYAGIFNPTSDFGEDVVIIAKDVPNDITWASGYRNQTGTANQINGDLFVSIENLEKDPGIYGVRIQNGSSLTVVGDTFVTSKTSSTQSVGILAFTTGTILDLSHGNTVLNVASHTGRVMGIDIEQSSKAILGKAEINLNASGKATSGTRWIQGLYGAGGNIEVKDDIVFNVTTYNDNQQLVDSGTSVIRVINLEGSAYNTNAQFDKNLTINVDAAATNVFGIYVSGDTSSSEDLHAGVNVDGLLSVNIKGTSDFVSGIYGQGESGVSTNQLLVNVHSDNQNATVYGVFSTTNPSDYPGPGSVNVEDSMAVNITGSGNLVGVLALGEYNDRASTVNIGGHSQIYVVADDGDAVALAVQSGASSQLGGLTAYVEANANDKNAIGIDLDKSDLHLSGNTLIETKGISSVGVDVEDSSLTLSGTAVVKGENVGIIANNSSEIALIKDAVLTTNSMNSDGTTRLNTDSTLSVTGSTDGESSLGNIVANSATIKLGAGRYVVTKIEGEDNDLVLTDLRNLSSPVSIGEKSGKLSVVASSNSNDQYANARDTAEALIGAINVTTDNAKDKNTFLIEAGDVNNSLAGTVVVNEDGSWTLSDVIETKNDKLDALGSVTALSALTLRHEMNSLSKRMGELRDASDGVGAWVRGYGSEIEYGSQNVTVKSNSIQVGSDYTIGDWKIGVAFTYTDGESSYDNGSADSKGYGIALYGTWFVPCGAYVDLMTKYNRLDNDFALNGMNGSYDANAYGISAETGYRFNFLDGGIYVEPQVGIAYSRMTGESFTAYNGVTIQQDDYDSLIGRAGLRAGFKFPKEKGTIYARISGVYDFQGEVNGTAMKGVARNTIEEDLGGAWVEMGVGANFNWTKSTYTYIDFERTNGGEVKENYRWNVGLRHTF